MRSNKNILDYFNKNNENKKSVNKSINSANDNLNQSTNFESINKILNKDSRIKYIGNKDLLAKRNSIFDKNKITNYFDEDKIISSNNTYINLNSKKNDSKNKSLKEYKINTFFLNNRKKQSCELLNLNKLVLNNICYFWDLSTLFKLSITSIKLYNICNNIYKGNKYFEKVIIDDFKTGEIRKLFKSSRIYFELIKKLVKAKNIYSYFSKNHIYFELKLYENEFVKNRECFKKFKILPKKGLISNGIDDDTLKFIAINSSKSLETLVLKNCDLLKNWGYITYCENLKILILDNNYYFDEEDLENILEKNKNIEILSISNCFKLSFSTLNIISYYGNNLKNLDISYNSIISSTTSFNVWNNCKKLKWLNLSGLKKFKNEHVKQVLCGLNNINVVILNYLNNLTWLDFKECLKDFSENISSMQIKGYYFSKEICDIILKNFPDLIVSIN